MAYNIFMRLEELLKLRDKVIELRSESSRNLQVTIEEYFEFLEEYRQLFSDNPPLREKIEMDSQKIKL